MRPKHGYKTCWGSIYLSMPQMQRLRSEFGIYGLDSGRICMAALNSRNLEPVAAAMAKVMR